MRLSRGVSREVEERGVVGVVGLKSGEVKEMKK